MNQTMRQWVVHYLKLILGNPSKQMDHISQLKV